MWMLASTSPPTLFDGYPVLANIVRLFIIFTGFLLMLLSLKVGVRAFRFHDFERGFASIGFALVVVTPSVTALYRFDEPLVLYTTIIYVTGLACCVVATYFRVTLRWHWWVRLKARKRASRQAHKR